MIQLPAALVGALLASVALALPWVRADAAELSPHRAAYDLQLRAGTNDIEEFTGAMLIEVGGSCEGWTLTQQVRLAVRAREGETVAIEIRHSSWESADGTRFQFSTSTGGAPGAEEIVGRVTLGAPAAPGQAEFTSPSTLSLPIPAGTLFPTTHIQRLLDAAAAGETRLSALLFDGSEAGPPFEVHALIGERTMAAEMKDTPAMPAWPVRFAYFATAAARDDGVPQFEGGVLLRADGIALQLDLDFGGLGVRGVLRGLERGPTPDC